jgi:CheY-like chemotaxis protein
MARVLALIPDLLFGSNVQGGLRAVGHDVRLVADEAGMREHLPDADVLVVDLASDGLDGCAVVTRLGRDGALADVRTLGFYSHVDADTRERAVAAGFDRVVPRSRMAREGAALVTQLAER